MKSTLMTGLLAQAAASQAHAWWGGAPECAHSCFSSAYSSRTDWPSPASYCDAASTTAAPLATCLSSACSATPTAWRSYSSLSASLCSRHSSCASAGSTGVHTITATGAGWGTAGAGHGHGHGGERDAHGPALWTSGSLSGTWGPPSGVGVGGGDWTSWASGGAAGTRTFTVTGCSWDGSPWDGSGGHGFGGWFGWGAGWSGYTTLTTTVPVATTAGAGGAGVTSGSTTATVAAAVSGDVTSYSTIGLGAAGAEETGAAQAGSSTSTKTGSGSAPVARGGVAVVGAALAGFVVFMGIVM